MLLQWQPAATMPLTAVAVALTETPGTFGGTRPWLLGPQPGLHWPCPGRVARLYIDGLRLGCRRCLGLAYASQREGAAALRWWVAARTGATTAEGYARADLHPPAERC